ncbi:MAG: fibronectin type III domain-containing protein [Candidatus Methylomirabilales bacterium]
MRVQPRLTLLLIGALLLGACGVKGNPRRPKPKVPAAVSDLRAIPRGQEIVLIWSRPTQNEDRSPLTDLVRFNLFHQVDGGVAKAVPIIPLHRPENAEVQDGLYIYRHQGSESDGLPYHHRYTYWVVALNARGRASRPSNMVSLKLIPPAEAPPGLVAEASDGSVRLKWQAPETRIDGGSLDGPIAYNIYRRRGDGPWRLIHPEPVAVLSFVDPDVVNGETYQYTLRSVDNAHPPWHEGPSAKEVAATPRDHAPPNPPASLRAQAVEGGVRLTWKPSSDADVVGYHIYRRELPRVAPSRITREPFLKTAHLDRGVRSRVTYGYTVTAEDRSGNESVAVPEVIVTTP